MNLTKVLWERGEKIYDYRFSSDNKFSKKKKRKVMIFVKNNQQILTIFKKCV